MKALVGAGTMWVPAVRLEDPAEYVPTPEALAAAAAELDRIQAFHEAECQRCTLCGQLALRLDDFGLCSKTSEPHIAWRQKVRRMETAAAGPRFRKPRAAGTGHRRAVTS